MSNELIDMLGEQLEDVVKSPFISELKTRVKFQTIDNRHHLNFLDRGLSFIGSKDGRVSSIQLHAAGHEGYVQYSGQLPGGVSFSDSRKSVHKLLGKPSVTGGGKKIPVLGSVPLWDRYDLQKYYLHIKYSDGAVSITLVSLMRPDVVPK